MERAFRPCFVGDIVPKGTLSCGDDFITDPEAPDVKGFWIRDQEISDAELQIS